MQGYNRAPLFDRLNSYSQIAFFVQFGDGWLDYHLIQVFELLIFIFNGKMVRKSSIAIVLSPVLRTAGALVNADAVGAGKAGDVLHDYPRKLPLELVRYGMMASEKVISTFASPLKYCARYCTQRNSSRFPRS